MKLTALHTMAGVILITVVQAHLSRQAYAASFDAMADTWIRESAPLTSYDADLISVWDGTTTDQRRHGVVMFDIGSTAGNIDSAFIQLFDRDDPRSASAPLVQEVYLLSITPPEIDGYTWDEYTTLDQQNEVALDSLGAYDIPTGDTINGYETSDLASAADLNRLEQVRDSNSGIVAFILKAVTGERDWGDIEYDGTPPRLVLNEDPPLLGDLDGNGVVNEDDFDVIEANWLQVVTAGEGGDLTFNGVVDLQDFVAFKDILLAQPNGSSVVNGVPEPSTIVLLLGATVILLMHRTRLLCAAGK